MTNFDRKDNTVDIPGFVEDKDTESTSVDMSIFKMSDEELYDDVPKAEKKTQDNIAPKKKSNATLILCLVAICILLVTTVVSLIYAVKEHGKVAGLQQQVVTLTEDNSKKQATIDELNQKITANVQAQDAINEEGAVADPDKKYKAGIHLIINEDGNSMGVTSAMKTGEDYMTDKTLYWGDEVVLTEDAKKDENGNYWGKIKDGYIRIEYNGEIWADIKE